jgi:hypothetical protein
MKIYLRWKLHFTLTSQITISKTQQLCKEVYLPILKGISPLSQGIIVEGFTVENI